MALLNMSFMTSYFSQFGEEMRTLGADEVTILIEENVVIAVHVLVSFNFLLFDPAIGRKTIGNRN